jgi:hypothetical protein
MHQTWLHRLQAYRCQRCKLAGLQLRKARTQCLPPKACLHQPWLHRLRAHHCQCCKLAGFQLRQAHTQCRLHQTCLHPSRFHRLQPSATMSALQAVRLSAAQDSHAVLARCVCCTGRSFTGGERITVSATSWQAVSCARRARSACHIRRVRRRRLCRLRLRRPRIGWLHLRRLCLRWRQLRRLRLRWRHLRRLRCGSLRHRRLRLCWLCLRWSCLCRSHLCRLRLRRPRIGLLANKQLSPGAVSTESSWPV